MDVEIGIRNDWKYFNTPPQSQPSILSLTLGSISCKAVPRMPAVTQGFDRVWAVHASPHQSVPDPVQFKVMMDSSLV